MKQMELFAHVAQIDTSRKAFFAELATLDRGEPEDPVCTFCGTEHKIKVCSFTAELIGRYDQ